MSDEDKTPRPATLVIAGGSHDAAVIVALNEQYRRTQQAANISSMEAPPHVPAPPPPPVFGYDGSQDAALIAAWEAHRRRSFIAAIGTGSAGPVYVPEDDFPAIVSQAVIIPYDKTSEGYLIRAATLPLLAIIKKIMEDASLMYQIDPRKWEEIIAASYEESGQFDEVTLTPRSGDGGKDVIAVKLGFGTVRLIESVKRYTPKHEVTADEVRSLLGTLDTY